MNNRFWLLYLVPLLLYALQVSFPYNLNFSYLTPNYLLFFTLAVLFLVDISRSWLLVIQVAFLLEISSELPLGQISLLIVFLLLVFRYFRRFITDDYFSLGVIPLGLLVYEFFIVTIGKFAGLDWLDVWHYLYCVAIWEFFLGLLFTAVFIVAIRYFVLSVRARIQIEK